jgi:hypothetical protein
MKKLRIFSKIKAKPGFEKYLLEIHIMITVKYRQATILAKIIWTPNFSNANINSATFFHEICSP